MFGLWRLVIFNRSLVIAKTIIFDTPEGDRLPAYKALYIYPVFND
ncbi:MULTISPECIES: hypothetical protein [Nostocaceae]|nr:MULTISPECIES: hypothetical protein [Nostocaceae]